MNEPITRRLLLERLVDPAMILAAMVAALYFGGWNYYRTYLLRLGMDPAGLGFSELVIAAQGAGAILTTFGLWFGVIFPFLIGVAFLVLLGTAADSWLPKWEYFPADRILLLLARIIVVTGPILILLAAGTVAGRQTAHDQMNLVKRGDGWDYKLATETVRGVPVAQADGRMWLLTCNGVRLVRLDDLQTISGPMFERLRTGSEDQKINDLPAPSACAVEAHRPPPGQMRKEN